MNIIVCIKPVPDISIISLSGDGEPQLDRDDLIYMVNQSDLAALELALQIKEQVKEGKVVLVSMTPPSNQRLLRRCLALGADEAICIWDRDLISSDSHITGM
ncbi:MAG: electron transfer flavoprotein subunit beta/FixA family protein, partial [candidate division Zixibacteria bacterium]|nr:electron transfer flavoprotein subunit beta/FixA family protein [Gammaproteobacteria bacterium]NIR65670.1 electron transfer flavoprotein subunit beta/FixA family protein [candidate division Zixibacteria bacterium]NIS47367.1 electron transfer flavoprotein subunit beta/FixA family protein [candidate division Zixibacteria bacterium]NIV07575.1 electron transfer flavoprotein subunit beta/FixA family protein [candidate division Zixibacteria bacterium]NIW40470.1 electron transfer flavoprotein subun